MAVDPHVFDITRTIQLAIAPVFLLTAIGTIINALTGRLARAVDRRRAIEEILPALAGNAYEEKFEHDVEILEQQFRSTMAGIDSVFGDSLPTSEFRRVQLFYTLFTAVYHSLYGLKAFGEPRPAVGPAKCGTAPIASHHSSFKSLARNA